ncbi:MAG: SET domain-containing protein-lysine N-methyltransferase [Alphaproteobacteria bacterium]|nr:SET domain-containing protein-lysine N-methyltransferase [Alphaproteobacteria bacterium]
MHDAAARGRILPVSNHRIEVGASPGRGRGIFAREAIAPGTLIEAAPVIVLPAADCPSVDSTIIYDYYFHWDGDPDGAGRGAIGLGLVTLCNHSSRPLARVDRNYARQTLDLIAIAEIGPGQEVTIDYGCTLWFSPQE